MIGLLVLALVILSMGCLVGCAVIAARPEKKGEEAQRGIDLKAAEARQRMEALGIAHIYKRPHYKPAADYLAPARKEQPQASNVAQIRKAKR